MDKRLAIILDCNFGYKYISPCSTDTKFLDGNTFNCAGAATATLYIYRSLIPFELVCEDRLVMPHFSNLGASSDYVV